MGLGYFPDDEQAQTYASKICVQLAHSCRRLKATPISLAAQLSYVEDDWRRQHRPASLNHRVQEAVFNHKFT